MKTQIRLAGASWAEGGRQEGPEHESLRTLNVMFGGGNPLKSAAWM